MSTILAVFAHPDDETFICGGTLAKYAAEGHHVSLICATKGEMGRRLGVPVTATRETIPDLREVELRNACEALGIRELTFLHIRDKTLEIQRFDALVDRVGEHMARLQPDVVITFHETLGGHPDHCTIGAATKAAFLTFASGHTRSKLFFVGWKQYATTPDAYGLRRGQMVTIDVSSHLREKLRAFRAHRTQSGLNEWLWKDERTSMSRLGNHEYFIQHAEPFAANRSSLME